MAFSTGLPWRCASRARLASTRVPLRPARVRRLHLIPELVHQKTYEENGVHDMISKEGFRTAWTEYMQLMISRLNRDTNGDIKQVHSIILESARQPDKAALFNHASMAYNNHFFFNGLTPYPNKPSHDLERGLSMDFGSMDELRRQFIDTADVMFGPGFVWLVRSTDSYRSFKLLTTYLAGSPLPSAHFRQQPANMATQNSQTAGGLSGEDHVRHNIVQNKVGTIGRQKQIAKGGVQLTPLLCVNTWEFVWLRDYGICDKRLYLERWWDRIDWHLVESLADLRRHSRTKLDNDKGSLYRGQGAR